MSSFQDINLPLLSLNVRGLRKYKTRRKMFTWICRQKGHKGITFLQETHSVSSDGNSWKNLWRGQMFCSHGTSNSCGVMTLVGKDLEFSLHDKVIHESGRLIILYCTVQGQYFVLVNIYALNSESEQLIFLKYLSESLRSLTFDTSAIVIIGGDFNCSLSTIDMAGGSYNPKLKSISLIKCISEESDLIDVWKVRNPESQMFTWHTLNPLIQRRLDYYLMSSSALALVSSASIISAPSTDHSAISLCFLSAEQGRKGPSHWQFNASLLNDNVYVQN